FYRGFGLRTSSLFICTRHIILYPCINWKNALLLFVCPDQRFPECLRRLGTRDAVLPVDDKERYALRPELIRHILVLNHLLFVQIAFKHFMDSVLIKSDIRADTGQ